MVSREKIQELKELRKHLEETYSDLVLHSLIYGTDGDAGRLDCTTCNETFDLNLEESMRKAFTSPCIPRQDPEYATMECVGGLKHKFKVRG